MEKELDPSVVKATQTSLGKYVKRPPLSEKLLKKPPFRFLHDIITTVLKSTGFFEGLFEEEELVSDNVKDRESKILFLHKVISVVGLTTGKSLSAKPSKIVAGQEPEKTNELLQCLAQALDSKLSSGEAVKKFKEGKNPSQISDTKVKEPKVTKKKLDTKNITSKSNDKLTTTQKKEQKGSSIKNGNPERISKSKDRESSTLKQESPPKIPSQKSKIINKKTQVENGDQPSANSQSSKKSSKITNKLLENSFDEKNATLSNSQKEPEINITDAEITLPEKDEADQGNLDTSYTVADTDLNSSSSQDLLESNNKVEDNLPQENNLASISESVAVKTEFVENKTKDDETTVENKEHNQDGTESKNQKHLNLRQDSTPSYKEIKHQDRIASAKNAETVPNNVRPTSVRPSSSRPGAPRFRDKHGTVEQGAENILLGKVNIIAENTTNEEEEEPSIIIVEHQLDDTSVDQTEQLSLNQHGHLVQQILDSQKEFSQVNGKTEIEWQFGAQKAREASYQEMELVRFNIQALSRVANPLGKLLDHIQEDVEVMRQELQQWTKTYEDTSKELLKQKAANDDSLLPLHTKIKQLDSDIKEKQDKIEDLKIVLHKNSSRIEKLLASGNVQ